MTSKISKLCFAALALASLGLTSQLSASNGNGTAPVPGNGGAPVPGNGSAYSNDTGMGNGSGNSSMPHNSHSGYSSQQTQQTPQPQTPQNLVRWYTDFNQALAAAQQQHKPILLFFSGSDWCGWCMRLEKEVFNTPEFASSVGNDFIFVEVDFPMNKAIPQQQLQQNNTLKEKFSVSGYPTVVILDANQNVIATTGYRPGGPNQYATYLKGLIGR